VSERLGKMRLPRAARADDENGRSLAHVAAGGDLVNERAIDEAQRAKEDSPAQCPDRPTINPLCANGETVAMLKLLKDICAEALEAAGYDELARWVRDAPRQAIRKVVRIVMRALGFKGKLDKKDADEIAKLKKETEAQPPAPEAEEEDDSALAQYLLALNAVVAAGSGRGYLLLDGFLHTDDCASLWVFNQEKAAQKDGIALEISDFGGGAPYIIPDGAGVQIYLLPKMERAKLLELNEQLGRSPGLPAELRTDDKPRVQFIYEHRLQTRQMVTKTAGGKRPRAIRREEDGELAITRAPEGIAAMFDSLRPALEARAKYADTLKKTVDDAVKTVSPPDKGPKNGSK
jgi:hypothetical protein